MDDNLKLMLAVLAKNLLTIICFVVLAIFFNKWWLALFSILFMTSVEKDKKINKED